MLKSTLTHMSFVMQPLFISPGCSQDTANVIQVYKHTANHNEIKVINIFYQSGGKYPPFSPTLR